MRNIEKVSNAQFAFIDKIMCCVVAVVLAMTFFGIVFTSGTAFADTDASSTDEAAVEIVADANTAASIVPAEATSDEIDEVAQEEIADEENPLGVFDKPHCWVHWCMLLGILITAVYGVMVVRRRLNMSSDIDDFEDHIIGRKRDSEEIRVKVGASQHSMI